MALSKQLRRVPMLVAMAGFTVAALAVAGCDSGTDPQPTSPIKVIHAAPGLGAYSVTANGRALGSLTGAGAGVADTVRSGDWTVQLEGSGADLGVGQTVGDGEALGVVLMDSETPTLLPYVNAHTGTGSRFVLVNAVPGTDLGITMQGPSTSLAVSALGYQESQPYGLNGGFYTVRAVDETTVDTMDLGQVFVPTGRSFVVLYPNPDGPGPPWSVVAF